MSAIQLLVSEAEKIEDFRGKRGRRYELRHLIALIVLAVVAGADDFAAIEAYCKSKVGFLGDRGLLRGGRIPSHDLFRLVLQKLDKEAFARVLAQWLSLAAERHSPPRGAADGLPPRLIHIDGKSLRASRDGGAHSRSALQIVSAYCGDSRVTVAQSVIDAKSCEKTAIPALLGWLDLRDALVTIDAVATYKRTAALIRERRGDYLLALKRNNKLLFGRVARHFASTGETTDFFQQENTGHGRWEWRKCYVVDASHGPFGLEGWADARSVILLESARRTGGKLGVEQRYYLSSLPPNAGALAHGIRRHWSVENELHWSLDVSFNEDRCRIKHKQAAANFAAIRRFALGLLRNANLSKLGIKNQRLQAAWDDTFLEKLFNLFVHVSQTVTI